jgi:hypothetical protein
MPSALESMIMELRGRRECQSCGAQWSYFETESIACPECGSPRSTAVDDGAVHTGTDATLDLGPARAAVEAEPLDRVAESAVEAARSYRQDLGFVSGGKLRPMPTEALVAGEVETVGATVGRRLQVTDAEEAHFLALLRAPVDGERPGPADVPETLHAERGLAVSRTVGDYRRDLRAYLKYPDDTIDAEVAGALSAIRARRKRIDALDGDVEPRQAERLVAAIRDLYAYLERDDEAALARIDQRLSDPR